MLPLAVTTSGTNPPRVKAISNGQESANSIIREAYATKIAFIAWDDAMTLATRHMKANNLRATTIQQYELAVKTLRKVFPKSAGPSDITPQMAEQFKVDAFGTGPKASDG